MQELGIESTLLNQIIDGKKTIEGRLGKPKYLKIHEGDRLTLREDTWTDGKLAHSFPDMARVEVVQVLYFETFAEMLEAVDYKQAVPNAKSVSEAEATYRQFYSKDDELEYGVVAFELTLL